MTLYPDSFRGTRCRHCIIDERCWLWLQRYRIADSYASNVL